MTDSASEDFYDRQLNSPNPIRRWWHKGRRELIHGLVAKYYKGGIIADLGCGNCTWNYRHDFNVVGIDRSFESLEYAMEKHRIYYQVCADVTDTKLRAGSIDLLVSSEVMEHIPDTDRFLGEVYRLLAKDGVFVLTLPYDTLISAWQPLFAAQCFLKGSIQHDPYYIDKCGHIHHFNKAKLRDRLAQNGLIGKEIGVYCGMTLFCAAVKK